jgi:hypothetical protein
LGAGIDADEETHGGKTKINGPPWCCCF